MIKSVVKLFVISALFVSSSALSSAQNTPYSFNSLGVLHPQGFAQNQLMGGLASSLTSNGEFNFVNPASLSGLELTSLQTTSFMSFVDQQSGDKRKTFRDGDFGNFALGIPLAGKKHIGFGAGLNRLTNVNYLIPGESVENGENVINLFGGQGGINEFQTALGAEITRGLSVGVGASFLFGNIEEISDKQFPDNATIFSVRNTQTTYFSGVKWKAGVQYNGQIGKSKDWGIGFQVAPSAIANTSKDQLVTTYNYQGNYYIDTLANREEATGEQELPMMYGGSVHFGKKDVWALGVQYSAGQWSKISQRASDNPYFDNQSFTIGGFWQSKEEMKGQFTSKSEKFSEYLKVSRIYYGFRSSTLYTGVVNEKVTEMAVSLGVGLPFSRTYTIESEKYTMVSRINVGVEYIMRGSKDNGLIQENILGIKFGLTLTDKWFNKRKYQ